VSRLAEEAAAAAGADSLMIKAIIAVESAWKPSAYRYEPGFWQRYLAAHPDYAGCEPRRVSASYGLMQIMYPTAVDMGYEGEPEGLFSPSLNLRFGIGFLMTLIAKAGGDAWEAIAAYNGGWGGRKGKDPQAYAVKVRQVYDALKEANG